MVWLGMMSCGMDGTRGPVIGGGSSVFGRCCRSLTMWSKYICICWCIR